MGYLHLKQIKYQHCVKIKTYLKTGSLWIRIIDSETNPMSSITMFRVRVIGVKVRIIVSNASFNNISVISWRSDLLVEETGENHRPAASHRQTLSHNVVSSTPLLSSIRNHNVSDDRHWLHM